MLSSLSNPSWKLHRTIRVASKEKSMIVNWNSLLPSTTLVSKVFIVVLPLWSGKWNTLFWGRTQKYTNNRDTHLILIFQSSSVKISSRTVRKNFDCLITIHNCLRVSAFTSIVSGTTHVCLQRWTQNDDVA